MKAEKIRILHLEDQRADADLVAWILRKANMEFETKIVDTRENYVKALTEFNPEIIISDHGMPAFNSMEALSILRQSGIKIPFILMTGAVPEEFAVEAMRAGADDYILKDRPQRLPIAIYGALEKYRREREQIKTEARLKSIDANSMDVLCIVDHDGRFLHVSAAALTTWGYHPSELQGRKYMELVFEEDAEVTSQVSASIMAGNPVTMFENRYIRKDGTVIPMLWSARWEDTDKVMYCIGKDATEKKKIEQVYKNELQRFNDMFLDVPANIGILKGPTHICEMFNHIQKSANKRNIIGRTVAEAFPEFESQGLIKLLDDVYHTGEAFSGKEFPIKVDLQGTGNLIKGYYNFVLQPYRDHKGKVEGVFFFVVDVTDQVQARNKIEESKKQYVHLLQNLPVAIYTCDATGRILLYNKAAVELWGRKPEIGKDKWCGSWKIYNKDGQLISHDAIAMRNSIKEGKNIYGEELIIERPDGTRRSILTHPSPDVDSKGNVIGAINMLIDVTERKRAETETLTLVDRLQLKNKELGQFAYMVSHNLRAPIARILGLASIFQSYPAETQFIVEKMAAETTTLDNVVKDLNMIVSARNSEKEEKEFVHYEGEFKLLMQVLEKEVTDTGALVTTDFHLSPGVITVKSYLYSILYNLLSNALKFRSNKRSLRIHLQTSEDGKYSCLTIIDNGIGIDLSKYHGKIFGLYKKFHEEAIPGKGIGLFLVKTHAESLGGRVEIESNVNEGTQFKIYIPKK